MKILHLNTNDIKGGAARAANRLHNALNKRNVESFMLVQRKQSNNSKIFGAKSNLFFQGINFFSIKIQSKDSFTQFKPRQTLGKPIHSRMEKS